MALAAKSVKAMKPDTLIDFVEVRIPSPNLILTLFLLETLTPRADVGVNAKAKHLRGISCTFRLTQSKPLFLSLSSNRTGGSGAGIFSLGYCASGSFL
jgi:hypothetical protein